MTDATGAPLPAEQTPEAPGVPTDPQRPSGGSPETHHEAATDLSPVTELRDAAKKLRNLTSNLGDNRGPWYIENEAKRPYPQSISNTGVPYVVATTYDGPQVPPHTALYIVAMHPGVGAELAKLLDLEADVIEARTMEDGTAEFTVDLSGDHLLAIARLINGEAGETQATAAPDFFQPGRTYTYAYWQFRCDVVTNHPGTGRRVALGWFRANGGQWAPFNSTEAEWAEDAWKATATPAGEVSA